MTDAPTTSPPPRRRRRHAAKGARILSAGLATSATLGITSYLTLDSAASSSATGSPVPTVTQSATETSIVTPPQPVTLIVVRRHHVVPDPASVPAPSAPATTAPAPRKTTAPAAAKPTPRPAPQPAAVSRATGG